MAISVTTNAPLTGSQPSDLATQRLAKQLASAIDSNKDGQISVDEFGAFLDKLLQGLMGGGGRKQIGRASCRERV